MNIKEALEYGINLLKENKQENPILKAKILLANILNKDKNYLLINEKELLDQNVVKKYIEDLRKICSGIPLQYITKSQEFFGLNFYVDENVLIPQPDTEILVEEVIKICKDKNKKLKILDLCTGSGSIGISIAKNINNCEVTLSDISIKALDVAKKNCSNLGKEEIKIIESDLFNNIKETFDIIVSNPPYIKKDVIKTLSKEVQNEPHLALDGGEDGLEIYKRIIKEAYKFLNKDGYLCLEIGYDQKEDVIRLLEKENNYKDIYSKKDLSRNDRIIICKKED